MNKQLEQSKCQKKFLGIFTRRLRCGLSARGWMMLILILVVTFFALMTSVQPFLAKTARADSRFLVVEGWVHEYVIRAAADEFKSGKYEKVFTTGGPVIGSEYINDFNTSANVGAELLEKAGVSENAIQSVPTREVGRDRTYTSAIALRDYFRAQNISVSAINLLTEDTHARRSQLLFQEAFGRDVKVGIISVHDPDYDARHWWRTSEGVRSVFDEGFAYIYARFFFFPAKTN